MKTVRPPGAMGRARFNTMSKPRVRMNAIPLMVNFLLPTAVFSLCAGISGFWLMYKRSGLACALLVIIFSACVLSVLVAVWQRKNNPEPTWYTYTALMMCLAAVLGTSSGAENFQTNTKRFMEISDMKTIQDVDVNIDLGDNMLDAGIVSFVNGTELNADQTWHYKHDKVYCVAPIMLNNTLPATRTVDFWAVGQDCCAIGSSDFRCGDWSAGQAHSAMRALDDDALMYYRLAVKQAETLYDLLAANPVFFVWVQHPAALLNRWHAESARYYLLSILTFFVFSLFVLLLTMCRFAYLGRSKSPYAYLDNNLHYAERQYMPSGAGYWDGGEYGSYAHRGWDGGEYGSYAHTGLY